MSDRELLELAAKAAGFEYLADRPTPDHLMYISDESCGNVSEWRPLTDDGDALRLAVKLRMDVCWNENEGPWEVNAWPRSGLGAGEGPEDHGDDPYAATRRAIVRAAAAIGMEAQKRERRPTPAKG